MLHGDGVANSWRGYAGDRRGGASAAPLSVRWRCKHRLDVGGHHHFRVGENDTRGRRIPWRRSSAQCGSEDAKSFNKFARILNEPSETPLNLRGLWELVPRQPTVPLDKVEPAVELVKRFATGAMSYGSTRRRRTKPLLLR